MILPRALKRFCDICFYMTFASIFGVFFGGENYISTLPIFMLVAYLGAFLSPYGRVKYLSIIPLFLVFFILPPTLINFVVLTPAILYMIWNIPKLNERITEIEYTEIFMKFLISFAIAIVFTAIFIGFSLLPYDTFLFRISFVFNAIIFMRLTRHPESIQKQKIFKIMNSISTVGAMIAALLMSTNLFLRLVGLILHYIFILLFSPLWLLLIAIFHIFGLDPLTFDLENTFLHELLNLMLGIGSRSPMMHYIEGTDYASQEGIPMLVILGFILVVVLAMIQIFRIIMQKTIPRLSRNDEIEEIRTPLDQYENKRQLARRYDNQIRDIYRDFLTLIKRKGVNVDKKSLTSYDVDQLTKAKFKSAKSQDLRKEYIRVRYGRFEYTKEDVRRVKGLYKEVEKALSDRLSKVE